MKYRIDLLNQLKTNYSFELINNKLVIINKCGKQLARKTENGKYCRYILFKHNKSYYFQEKEIIAILTGNISNKRFSNKRFSNICKICNLDYPLFEMRGDICYLCKEEAKNGEGCNKKIFGYG